MHIERERQRNNGGGGIGDYYYHVVDRPLLMESSSKPFPFSSSSSSPPLPPSYSPSAGGVGAGYIEHPVSKFDTLAGVAIKYGVEVDFIAPYIYYHHLNYDFCLHSCCLIIYYTFLLILLSFMILIVYASCWRDSLNIVYFRLF